jgi:hypothetical protein
MSGIGEHDVGALADGLAGVLGRIAIVGECADLGAHLVDGGLQFVELIFGQGFGGEKIHGAGAGIGEQQVQDGQVVAQRLAAGGGRDDHHVLALFDRLEGLGLVGIELLDAAVRPARAAGWGSRHRAHLDTCRWWPARAGWPRGGSG